MLFMDERANFFDVPTVGGSSLFVCVLAQNGTISVHTKRTQTIRAVRRNAERTSRLVGTARSLSYLFAHKTAPFSCLFQMRANASHGWAHRNLTPLILTINNVCSVKLIRCFILSIKVEATSTFHFLIVQSN
jgi:hypothetical protein